MKKNGIFRKLLESLTEVVNGIMCMKNNPLYGISILSSTIALGVSFITGIVAYVIFILQGGYEAQIGIIKIGDIDKAFSDGTVSILYQNGIIISTLVLLTVSFACMLLLFFKNETIIKKIIIIICLILSFLIVVIPIIGKLKNEDIVSILENKFSSKDIERFFLILIGICAIIIIVFSIIMIRSICSFLFRYVCTVTIMTYCLIPLLLYLLENIIATIALTLLIVLLGAVMIFFVLSIFSSDGSKSTNSENNSLSKKSKIDNKNAQPQIIKFDGNVRFFRDKGGYGFMTPTDDCIYYTGNMVEHRFACTVKDYEQGKVIIMLNGKQITNI